MRIHVRSLLTGVAALAVTAGLLVAAAGVANAAPVTPGWETDPNAVGTITFASAAGCRVTGGDLSDHPTVWYAVASAAGRAGDSKAQLRAYTPQEGVATIDWSGDSLTSSTSFPNPTAPTGIAGLTVPVASGAAGDLSLAEYIDELPNTSTTAGYQNLYELRLYTSGPGQGASASYFRVDIRVRVTGLGADGLPAGTWTVVRLAA